MRRTWHLRVGDCGHQRQEHLLQQDPHLAAVSIVPGSNVQAMAENGRRVVPEGLHAATAAEAGKPDVPPVHAVARSPHSFPLAPIVTCYYGLRL